MPRSSAQLRRDALRIWQAGVEAVRSPRLVRQALHVEGPTLVVGSDAIPVCGTAALGCADRRTQPGAAMLLDSIRRIAVVGAGKAGAGMAEAVEEVLGPQLMAEKQLVGWVNVPADCVRTLQRIHLHAARPAGVNEPQPEGVAGAGEILQIVESLGPEDLCLCLISGGGSALMPAPVEGVTLADKLAVTRHLSAAGANIEQLNTVRKQLSRIKGGGLLRACRAGWLVSLVISDVLGDPLGIIASGPTIPDSATPQDALDVLERFSTQAAGVAPAVFDYLQRRVAWASEASSCSNPDAQTESSTCRAINLVIGNNATAVTAAGQEAERLGYSVATTSAGQSEGPAEEIGRRLADTARNMRAGLGPTCRRPLNDGANPETTGGLSQFSSDENGTVPFPGATCLVSGGEPVVRLVDSLRRGLGGRNQQLVLSALLQLADDGADRLALLSGGTDGEDGPTDAAGALLDADVLAAARQAGLDAADYLARNDAYHFFAPLGALLHTGPTHTNVCDLRVVVVERL